MMQVQQVFEGVIGAAQVAEGVRRQDTKGAHVFVGDSVVQADAFLGR